MAANGFTLTTNLFTGEVLTNSNTLFFDANFGSDSNPGTREFPKQTINITDTNTANIVNFVVKGDFSNILNLSVSNKKAYILGDLNTNLGFFSISTNSNISVYFVNLNINKLNIIQGIGTINTYLYNCTILSFLQGLQAYYTPSVLILNCFASTLYWGQNNQATFKNVTVRDFKPMTPRENLSLFDSIFTDSIDLFTNQNAVNAFIFNNCIILKSCAWLWNSTLISINWTSAGNEINDIKESLTYYKNNTLTDAAQKSHLDALINSMFGAGTIIYDDKLPSNARIFNKYDAAGNVLDYTLNLDWKNNPALFTGFNKSYVGAYRPSVNFSFNWGNISEIDNNGANIGAGTLLKYDATNGIYCDLSSQQNRNKVSTNILEMLKGDSITRFQGNFYPSLQFYLGALQQSPTVSKQNAIVVHPYDTPTSVSAYPIFCIPINKNVQIAVWESGTNAGKPILYSNLAGLGIAHNKNLAEVGTWAITNAMEEWDDVVELATTTVITPQIRYFMLDLIVNRV